MPNIALSNEDGVLYAVDTSTGDRVPIEFDELALDGQTIQNLGPNRHVEAGLRDGLVGHWPLDGNTSEAKESTTNTRSMLTPNGASTATGAGAFGDAIRFGTGEYGRIINDGGVNVEGGDFTMACYVRVPANDNGYVSVVHKRPKYQGDTQCSIAFGIQAQNVNSDQNWGPGTRGAPLIGHGTGGGVTWSVDDRLVGDGPLIPFLLTYDSDSNRASLYANGWSRVTSQTPDPLQQTGGDLFCGVKLNSSGNIDKDSELIISDLRVYDRKLSYPEIRAHARRPFEDSDTFKVTRRGKPWPNAFSGPCHRYDPSKTQPHRVLIKDNPNSRTDVFAADNWYGPYSQVAQSVFSGCPNPSTTESSDYVEYDGTQYVYATDDTQGFTVYFTGSDWTSLTYQGEIVSDTDGGTWILDDGTTFLYTEDADVQAGYSSERIAIWEATAPDGSFSEVGTALDLTDLPIGSGDPCIFEEDGRLWMVSDNDTNHPRYGTLLAVADNPYDWSLIDEDCKVGMAGDLEVSRDEDGNLIGFCELDGGDGGGVSTWELSGPV